MYYIKCYIYVSTQLIIFTKGSFATIYYLDVRFILAM